ncbi:hypothetical protein [uncultured Tateyamaria sp.]|uniref:hypothetical protein n=1 Tax=uncultured Tateyamaria sp. TaxID=455651 RepID=UPI002635C28E|nr:hypothetical protein [uncultured Tateyamaria sp.]
MISEVPPLPAGNDPNARQKSPLELFAQGAVGDLRDKESYITDEIFKSVKSDSELMQLPDHVTELFKKWESRYTNPEDAKLVQSVKRKIIEMHGMNTDLIKNQVQSVKQKVEIEFALKGISKATSGLQQLLSGS